MKKTVLILTAALAVSSASYSQSMLDKAKEKTGLSKSETNSDFQSMSDVAAKWQDGKYSSKYRSSGMYQPGGKVEIKFNKDANGKVGSINIDGKAYTGGSTDAKPFAISYTYRNYSLYLTESSIVKYRFVSNKVFVDACYGKKMGIKGAEKEITEFRAYAEKIREEQQNAHYAKLQEESAKAAEERKQKFGLEGKDVASIEIINLEVPDKFGYFRGFKFDIKATLKDGSMISTEKPNEGFESDYTISYSAENYQSRGIDGMMLQSGFLDSDEITVTVTSKHAPSLKATKTVQLKYNEDVSFNYRNGASSSSGNGSNAMNYRFEVKQVKHTSSGEKLLKVRIVNVSEGGEVVSEFKMHIDQTLHFSCNGGNGGDDGTRFNAGIGNGGNGGNIVVIKDPNVEYFNFSYSNIGGSPGPNYSARRGRDGQYKEETRAVKL